MEGKGLTPIITIIILLLVAVSLAGTFFVWVTRQQTALQTSIENQTQKQATDLTKSAKIDNIISSSQSITIRNTGTSTITIGEVSVYRGGARATCSWGSSVISPQNISTCDITNPIDPCPGGTEIKVFSPGTPNGDKSFCP